MNIKSCLYVFLLLITFPAALSAQKITFKSDPVDNNGLNYLKVIGQDDDGFYVLYSNLSLETERDRFGLRTRKYRLGYYTFDLKEKWQEALTAHPSSAGLETVSFYNNHVVVISSDYNKQDGKLNLFLDVYGSSGLTAVAGRQVYSESAGKNDNYNKPRLFISSSKDLLGVCMEEERDNDVLVHFAVIDTSYKGTVITVAAIPYPFKDLEIRDYAFSKPGELLILAQLNLKDPQADRKHFRSFRLFALNPDRKSFREHFVNSARQNMTDASLVIDRKNNTGVVAGFYADKESFAGTGVVYARLKLGQNDSLQLSTFAINGEAQQKLVGERNTGNAIGLFNYPVQRIILRQDGGAVLVAEAAYISEYSYYDYFTQSFNRRTEYHFDNIVFLSLNANGTVDWSQVVRKTQTSTDDDGYYSSFCSMVNADELVVLFNDDLSRNNSIVTYTVDNFGKMENRKLSYSGDNYSILPRSGRQVDERTIIVPAVTRKKLYLARVDF